MLNGDEAVNDDDEAPANGIARDDEGPPAYIRMMSAMKTIPLHQTIGERYSLYEKVGAGTFGEVFLAFSLASNERVAVKRMKLDHEKEGFPITAVREIKILTRVRDENIVRLFEVMNSFDGGEEREASPSSSSRLGTVNMVFEYGDFDLKGLMESDKITLTESHCMCIMKQLLSGLHYIHTNNIIHRDIKPSNILVTNEGRVKIADWGLGRVWRPNGRFTNTVITLWYRPPELCLGEVYYTPAVDVWSVGCLFAELLWKKPLLPGADEIAQLKLIFELCGSPPPELWSPPPSTATAGSSQPPPALGWQRLARASHFVNLPPPALANRQET